MERRNKVPEFERLLAQRLKQVRDSYASDHEQFLRTRDVVLRKARKKRFARAFQGMLVATALILGAFALPARFAPAAEPPRVATRAPARDAPELPTDPWVVAGAHHRAVIRDGWVPLGTST